MTELNVVPIRDGEPLLTDIPGMLRSLADAIERGDYDKVTTAFFVLPVEDDYPTLFGWGDVDGRNDPIIQLELAKAWLLAGIVARR